MSVPIRDVSDLQEGNCVCHPVSFGDFEESESIFSIPIQPDHGFPTGSKGFKESFTLLDELNGPISTLWLCVHL